MSYLFWEPMSVGREFGHTIESCAALQRDIDAANLPIPLKMMVDIDHGDVTSSNPADVDPYAWAEAFPKQSPIIHIKQSSMNKGGHWPFTAAYNKDGRITPQKLLDAVRRGGGIDNEICLELSFRESEPVDHQVVAMIREVGGFLGALHRCRPRGSQASGLSENAGAEPAPIVAAENTHRRRKRKWPHIGSAPAGR